MDLAIDKNMIDKDEYPQTAEIERRCVHMMADLWNAPEAANTVGASAIGSSEACMLGGMAAKWRWRAKRRRGGQVDRQAEHGLRAGAGRVAQVRALLGHRDARGPDGARPLHDDAGGRARAGRREHHLRGADPGRHLHRHLRAGEGDRRRARPAAGRDRAGRRHPRRRGQRRVPRTVLRARPGVGLPAAAGEVDQHLGPQVRPRAARRRLGRVARRGRAAGRPDLPRELPRRRHAGVPDQLLPARPARSSRSTTTSSGSVARATGSIHDACYADRPGAREGRSRRSARSRSSATATRRPASRP